MKTIEVKSKPKVNRTYYLFCPVCKREIGGISQTTCIRNFKTHFDCIHPDKKYEDYLFKFKTNFQLNKEEDKNEK